MASVVSIKFNDEESEVLARAHAASGVAGVSSHIKQVYFDALELNVSVLQEIRGDLDRIGSNIERLRRGDDARTDPQMLLSILCGLYVMVRKSVGDSIRAQADQALDVSAIERYLSGP
ncbi:hypothetical protein QTH97_26185 [Variovorax sp. J22R24]|uniref:hypothetical protein n=1 Tax=Variovorax gracilis TaxID=3053502 RepID=UPI002578836F|nr:hypothetical protein [Variovorax sp. J22R24]MDM0108465.1 hypothetical protein [Variovorax sp. J22R24]